MKFKLYKKHCFRNLGLKWKVTWWHNGLRDLSRMWEVWGSNPSHFTFLWLVKSIRYYCAHPSEILPQYNSSVPFVHLFN